MGLAAAEVWIGGNAFIKGTLCYLRLLKSFLIELWKGRLTSRTLGDKTWLEGAEKLVHLFTHEDKKVQERVIGRGLMSSTVKVEAWFGGSG